MTYFLDAMFVLLVVAILCAYRLYCGLRWVLDWRARRRAKR